MEPQPQPSSPCNDKRRRKKKRRAQGMGSMSEDVVHNILERLPAKSFAFASCVSRSWLRVSRLALSSRPALASALSLNPSPTAALEEVVEKVLSAPIRPGFALAHVAGSGFGLNKTLLFLGERLGWSTPIVVTRANGVMGRNVATSEYLEFNGGDDVHDHGGESKNDNSSGVVLTVGFLPGIKVGVVPLLHPKKEVPNNATFQQFLTDIKSFSVSASDSTSPAVIMMFGNRVVDQKPIIDQLDKALSKETIIVGDERTQFSYRTGKEPKGCSAHTKTTSDSVALVLARDSNNPRGTGEIKFHTDFSRGLSAIGPVYRAVSVRTSDSDCSSTWLTAKRDGNGEILDGTSIMSEINDELERYVGCPELYIGISRRRKCFTGCEKSTLTFHGLVEGNEDYLTVDGTGIRTRDYFQFYMSDPDVALSSCNEVTAKIKNLKLEWNPRNPLSHRATDYAGTEFIGGLVFACCGRGESFFARTNVDSSPFLANFPGAPLAGIYCCGEIARGISTGYPGHCCTHVYSTVYLGLSYTPASLQE